MSECVFCKIVKQQIPCFQLFEDDLVKVFLDVNPVSNGHLLVIPKKHYENIFKVPSEALNRIIQVCQKMSVLCKDKLGATGVNILNASGKDAQQTVFHLHFHVIPRFKNDKLDLFLHNKSKNLDKIKQAHQKLLS